VAYKVAFVMDELAWRDPRRVARRMQILKEAIRRMQMDHRLNDPLRPFSCRVFYEHEPPSHKFTFDMDGFGWGDLRRAGRRMQILLDSLTKSLVAAFLERDKLTVAECEKLFPDVARRTLQRDLKTLVDAGLVREGGHGATDPTRHYVWFGGESR
jgi:hypothetical protein